MKDTSQAGGMKARAILQRYGQPMRSVAWLSAVLNVLMLGGSIYMMMVYDSVLPSHSLPTLLGLFAMITLVYLFQAGFDQMRQRILSDLAATIDRQLAPQVQRAMGQHALRSGKRVGDGLTAMRDLDAVRGWLSGGGPAALIDLPWIVLFLVVVGLLHPLMMLTTLLGALVMLGLTWMTDRVTRDPLRELSRVTAKRNGLAESMLRHGEVLCAMGMGGRMQARWARVNHYFLAANDRLSQTSGTIGGASKAFRMFLQSALLTVGALLVIDGRASAGIIFAGNILCARALAPIDGVIAQWRSMKAARGGWERLQVLLAQMPEETPAHVQLPNPTQTLMVQQIFATPPGSQRVTVQGVDFTLSAGQALGIVGPSASGKTSLARLLTGVWKPARGAIRLDGATLDQWDGERLGAVLGYLPQTVELLEGSVAENIARFAPNHDSHAIIAAAKAAGVHDLIVTLPDGYDTAVGADGAEISAGQRQRIGLARALYGDPFLVVLDEPNSNLDAQGEAALEQAIAGICARGGIAVVIAHRPSVLARVSHILFMRDGKAEAFGPRDEVLRQITRQPQQKPSEAQA